MPTLRFFSRIINDFVHSDALDHTYVGLVVMIVEYLRFNFNQLNFNF
jgi:hypothetical protein